MQYVKHPYLQIRSDCIVCYDTTERHQCSSKHFDIKKAAQSYSGLVRSHTQKRIMKAVDLLLQRNPKRRIYNPVISRNHDFQVGFCTLTIPARKPVKASDAYENLLKPFLRTARKKWGVEDYIWKAELQRRGQIHYHITWAEFVNHSDIRNAWNNRLRKMRLTDDYARKHLHHNPNSTDIHAVWRIRDLKAYLAKYIAKENQNKKALDGKVWDCNKELKRKYFSIERQGKHEDIMRDAEAAGQAKIINLENCVIVKCNNPAGILDSSEMLAYKQFIS